MKYYIDSARHLICIPYTRTALLAMAAKLGIPPHWYHGGKWPHIDVPVQQIDRLQHDPRVTVVTTRQLLNETRLYVAYTIR